MNNSVILSKLNTVPGFDELDKLQQATLQRCSTLHCINAGDTVFSDHAACNHFVWVTAGTAQLQKISPDGHEIVLYHLKKGQTCGLTASCLLGHTQQHANLIAGDSLEVLLLPYTGFQLFIKHSPTFHSLVLATIDKDIDTLIHLMEDVTFGRIEKRLEKKLLDYCRDSPMTPIHISITHQALAIELGTAREVISRALKKLEHTGNIKLHRGYIEILNPDAIRDLL